MILHQPHRAFAHFGGKLRLICHDSILSKLGASAKPGVIQVQEITEQWLIEYNEYRPHESLGDIPPVQFMPRLTLAPNLYQPLST